MKMYAIEIHMRAASELKDSLAGMTFTQPVSRVYNPLVYAWNVLPCWKALTANGRS